MQLVEFDLSITDEPWGTVLQGEINFDEAVRFLLFAWCGKDLSWAKSSGFATGATLDICYGPRPRGRVQLMARISDTVSTDLTLKSNQIPTTGMRCLAQLSVPSVLYETRNHGVGLLALPHGTTKSRKKRLWHIKPAALTAELAVFEQAYGRRGQFVGHPFG